jgi:hypothetical protein
MLEIAEDDPVEEFIIEEALKEKKKMVCLISVFHLTYFLLFRIQIEDKLVQPKILYHEKSAQLLKMNRYIGFQLASY